MERTEENNATKDRFAPVSYTHLTSAHAQSLKNSQDYYDRSAENYTWNE